MCDFDAPEAFRVTWRKARKAHACSDCGTPIVSGERYHFASGIWDGQPESFKSCAPCASLRTAMYDAHRESERAVAEHMKTHHSYAGAPSEIPCPEGHMVNDVTDFRESGAVPPGPLMDALVAFDTRHASASNPPVRANQ